MDSFVIFDETKLPFFSKLSGVYTHNSSVADYHDIYLQFDVLLLADFFETFRTTCLEYYSLDPIHYYTTLGLAWEAALRMSRVDLQLITDVDVYHFVENSI